MDRLDTPGGTGHITAMGDSDKIMYSERAIEVLRLVYPHHKEVTGKPCDENCYRCEIERYVKKQEEGGPHGQQ